MREKECKGKSTSVKVSNSQKFLGLINVLKNGYELKHLETLKTSFLVCDQRDSQIPFYVYIFVFNSLRVSSTSCSSSGETNCAGWEFTPNLHTTRPPTQSDSYQKLY
jgi:hypothetical protein